MFIVANFLKALASVVDIFFTVWIFLFIGRAITSFVSADPYNPIVRILHDTTEPLVRPIRNLLPSRIKYFPLDISFLLAFMLLVFLKEFTVATLVSSARYFSGF